MKTTDYYTSVANIRVKYDVYVPAVVIRYKGVVQVHHGASEDADQYVRLCNFLANNGYVVVALDLPGHGESLKNRQYGYLGDNFLVEDIIEDIYKLRIIVGEDYPELPYFMLGNQLGTLLIRRYIMEHGNSIEGAILVNPRTNLKNYFFKKIVLKGIGAIKGEKHHSQHVKDYVTNKIIRNKHPEVFEYPVKTVREILEISRIVNKESLAKKVPEYLPLCFISGSKSRYSHHGNDIEAVKRLYQKAGVSDLSSRVFDGEEDDLLFNENRQEVYRYIVKWLDSKTYVVPL